MEQFVWTSRSVVTGPKGPVTRPYPAPNPKVVMIPPLPTTACLQQAAATFLGGSEFCITDTPALTPPSQAGAAGYFQCLTSGSSGEPKRLRRSHSSWTRSFQVNADKWNITDQECYAVPGALSHSLALYGCLEALYLGADLLLLSDLRPDRQAAQMAKHKASLLYATPTQLRQISSYAASPLPSLRTVIIGGAALDLATKQLAAQLCPNARVLEFYGAAETSFISLSDSQTPAGSVGRAYHNVEISIRDPHGNAVAQNEQGEVWVRSPYLFSGYCSNGAATAYFTANPPAADWISVGEVGRVDSAGYLFVTGRQSRMFTVADKNIFPEQIERWFQQRGVDPVAVLPRHDPKLGNIAVLVTTEQDNSTNHLKQLCKGLAMHAIPRAFITIDSWPRLASGKTDLQALAVHIATRL